MKSEHNKSIKKTWNNCRKACVSMEVSFIICACFIILFGTIFDYEVASGIVRVQVDEFSSFVLSMLGIQSTISTLTIALVALISNNISETYLGISLSNYYLNLRPLIFKQNRIIYISLILIALSCISYVFGLYNLVIALFFVTILLIILSVLELYYLFRGLRKAKDEIELFVAEKSQNPSINEKEKNRRLTLISDLISDWTEKVNLQTQNEYDNYKDAFFSLFGNLLKHNNQVVIESLSELSSKQIYAMLRANDDEVKERGIELLLDIYHELWRFTLSEDFTAGTTNGFNLLGEVYIVLVETLKNLPLQIIERCFDWKDLEDLVSRTSFRMVSEDSKLDYSNELEALLRFSTQFGRILKYKERNNEYISDTAKRWGSVLETPYLDSAYNIPEERAERFLKYKCKVYFYYCKGFIDNNYINVIEEWIHTMMFRSVYRNNKQVVLLFLAVNCYLYYLGEKESILYVDHEIQEAANKFLNDEGNINFNDYILEKIHNAIFDYSQIEDDLKRMLNECEWFGAHHRAKQLIMQPVVREFSVFIRLMTHNEYGFSHTNPVEINGDVWEYVDYFLCSNVEHTKSGLKKFYKFYQNNKKDIDAEVEKMYKVLEEKLILKFKEYRVKQAELNQQSYILGVNESELIDLAKKQAEGYLSSGFDMLKIATHSNSNVWSNRCAFTYEVRTDELIKKLPDTFYSDIFTVCNSLVISEVFKKKFVSKIHRDQFEDDEQYMDFLDENGYNTYIGPAYVIKYCKDYRYSEKLEEYLKNKSCIFSGLWHNSALLLKGNCLEIRVKQVDVRRYVLALEDLKYEYDCEKNIYWHDVSNNIKAPFTEEELLSFVNNRTKVLDVQVELEFMVNGTDIGSYLIVGEEYENF